MTLWQNEVLDSLKEGFERIFQAKAESEGVDWEDMGKVGRMEYMEHKVQDSEAFEDARRQKIMQDVVELCKAIELRDLPLVEIKFDSIEEQLGVAKTMEQFEAEREEGHGSYMYTLAEEACPSWMWRAMNTAQKTEFTACLVENPLIQKLLQESDPELTEEEAAMLPARVRVLVGYMNDPDDPDMDVAMESFMEDLPHLLARVVTHPPHPHPLLKSAMTRQNLLKLQQHAIAVVTSSVPPEFFPFSSANMRELLEGHPLNTKVHLNFAMHVLQAAKGGAGDDKVESEETMH